MDNTIEVSNTDNSNIDISSAPDYSDNAIKDILNAEPVGVEEKKDQETEFNIEEKKDSSSPTKEEEQNTEKDDEIAVPEKFKNEDGTLNTNSLLKSYLSLEPVLQEKALLQKEKQELEEKAKLAENLQEEREKFARNLGFENYELLSQYQNKIVADTRLAKYEANEYSRHLDTVANPDEVKGLLIQYAQNPNPNLLKLIEAEFDVTVIKDVTQNLEQFKNQIEHEKRNEEYQRTQNEAKEFVTNAVTKHRALFNDDNFKELFSECLKVAGNRFDPDELVKLYTSIRENAVKSYVADQAKKEIDSKTTDMLQNITSQTKPVEVNTDNLDIMSIPASDLDKCISKFI